MTFCSNWNLGNRRTLFNFKVIDHGDRIPDTLPLRDRTTYCTLLVAAARQDFLGRLLLADVGVIAADIAACHGCYRGQI